jgi:hypothetical protein
MSKPERDPVYTAYTPVDVIDLDAPHADDGVVDLTLSPPRRAKVDVVKKDHPASRAKAPYKLDKLHDPILIEIEDDGPVGFPDLNEVCAKSLEKVLDPGGETTITRDAIQKELDKEMKTKGTIRTGWLHMDHIFHFVEAIKLAGFKISGRVRILDGRVMSLTDRRIDNKIQTDYTARLETKSLETKKTSYRDIMAEEVVETLQKMLPDRPKDTVASVARRLKKNCSPYAPRKVVRALQELLPGIKRPKETVASIFMRLKDEGGPCVAEEVVEALRKMLPGIKRPKETVASIFRRLEENGGRYVVLAPIISNGSHWTLAHITYNPVNKARHKLHIRLFDSYRKANSESTDDIVAYGTPDDSPAFHCRELIAAFNAMDPLTTNEGSTTVSDGVQQHQGNSIDCSLFVCIAILRSIYGAIPDFSLESGKNQVSAQDIADVRYIIAAMTAYTRELGRADRENTSRQQKDVPYTKSDGSSGTAILLPD